MNGDRFIDVLLAVVFFAAVYMLVVAFGIISDDADDENDPYTNEPGCP